MLLELLPRGFRGVKLFLGETGIGFCAVFVGDGDLERGRFF